MRRGERIPSAGIDCRKIARRRLSQFLAKHGNECARTAVAKLVCDRVDALVRSEHGERMEHELTPEPLAQTQRRLLAKNSLQRPTAGPTLPGEHVEWRRQPGPFAHQCRKPGGARVGRQGQLQWNCSQTPQFVYNHARQPRLLRIAAIERPDPVRTDNQFPQQRRNVHYSALPKQPAGPGADVKHSKGDLAIHLQRRFQAFGNPHGPMGRHNPGVALSGDANHSADGVDQLMPICRMRRGQMVWDRTTTAVKGDSKAPDPRLRIVGMAKTRHLLTE